VEVETSWRDRNFIPPPLTAERATGVNSGEFAGLTIGMLLAAIGGTDPAVK